MLPTLRPAIIRPFFQVARCYGGGHHGMTLKEQCQDRNALMDLLPTPQGDFKTKYGARNRKYNMHLLLSALFLGAGLYADQMVGAHTTPSWELPKDYNIFEVMKEREAEAEE